MKTYLYKIYFLKLYHPNVAVDQLNRQFYKNKIFDTENCGGEI